MTVRYIFVHFYKQYHREMVQVNAITTKKSTASYICEEEDDLRLRLTAVETEQTWVWALPFFWGLALTTGKGATKAALALGLAPVGRAWARMGAGAGAGVPLGRGTTGVETCFPFVALLGLAPVGRLWASSGAGRQPAPWTGEEAGAGLPLAPLGRVWARLGWAEEEVEAGWLRPHLCAPNLNATIQ